MIKTIKDAFFIVKDYSALGIPIVTYFTIMFLVMPFFYSSGLNFASLMFIIAFSLLTVAFLAGWLYMVKKSVKSSKKEYFDEEEKILKSFNIIKKFFPGVSQYFIPLLLQTLVQIILLAIFCFLTVKVGKYLLPALDFTKTEIKTLLLSNQASIKLLYSLSPHRLLVLNIWLLYISISSFIYTLLTIYWHAALFYTSKNPFVALWNAIKFLAKKPLQTFGILLFLITLYFILSVFSAIGMKNIILYFITLILTFYYAIYYVVVIFLYYEKENNSNSRANRIG